VSDEKYSHHFTDLLGALGYTHCFFVPGGNIMHLLDSARTRMVCVPFVHEVSAAIAAEYFNEVSLPEDRGRSYVLVTAGPGITNAVTGMAGAFLESRECLVVGGQVKSADLSHGILRQRGIQEIDGVAIANPVCKESQQILTPLSDDVIVDWVSAGTTDRRGPVFLEFCLDAQGAAVPQTPPVVDGFRSGPEPETVATAGQASEVIISALHSAQRPIILIGGGVRHDVAQDLASDLARFGAPIMTTWNGADRITDDHPLSFGRPNTWGQRYSNVLLAQADVVVALGTRLGLQQTGFQWQDWTAGHVIQIDVDANELAKGHPRVDEVFRADANTVLRNIAQAQPVHVEEWIDFCREVQEALPSSDPANSSRTGYYSPFALVEELSEMLTPDDVIIPASSGSGQFVPMEVFRSKGGQRIITNKGLAAMGYGLAAATGAALAAPERRTILIEGDGSFSQNIQELGTIAVQRLNVKVFLLDNDGYASIRTTQRNYFDGQYLGCDASTGLGFPDWKKLAEAFGIPWVEIQDQGLGSESVLSLLNSPGPAMFIVKVDPDQTYFPKVTSRISEDGSMISNPIHHMSPELPPELASRVFRYGRNER
jgi:acetolactate synthase-1/2/3 large subunit